MINRRNFLAVCSGLGLAGTLFPGALLALAQGKEKVTPQMVDEAAKIADVKIPADDVKMMLSTLDDQVKDYNEIYNLHLSNGDQPAFIFDPYVGSSPYETIRREMRISRAPAIASRGVPKNLEDVAF